jgi:D-threo-aldose 1-dehydrogenase
MTLGYGTAALGRSLSARERLRLIEAAYDAGVRYFDTAPLYGAGAAEEALGRFLAAGREVTVATKVGIVPAGLVGVALRRPPTGGRFSPGDIRAQLERSLRRLRLERVDTILLHEVDAASALGALETLDLLRDEGKLRHLGIATGPAESAAVLTARIPDVVQLSAGDDVDPHGARLILHSVLAGRVGTTPAATLLRAVADAHPDAVVLVGSRSEQHIREAAAALS